MNPLIYPVIGPIYRSPSPHHHSRRLEKYLRSCFQRPASTRYDNTIRDTGTIRDTRTGYETPKLSRGEAHLWIAFTIIHAAWKESSPVFSMNSINSAAPRRTPPVYSEIEKELLARREAACFGATSGA
jgi:hypothetical protein